MREATASSERRSAPSCVSPVDGDGLDVRWQRGWPEVVSRGGPRSRRTASPVGQRRSPTALTARRAPPRRPAGRPPSWAGGGDQWPGRRPVPHSVARRLEPWHDRPGPPDDRMRRRLSPSRHGRPRAAHDASPAVRRPDRGNGGRLAHAASGTQERGWGVGGGEAGTGATACGGAVGRRRGHARPVHEKSPQGLPCGLSSRNNAGSDLLSHALSHAVPSAVSGLTSVFGMGTGVTLIL